MTAPVLINPLELLTYWEGRGRQRPLSVRAIARRLNISATTVRTRLLALRAAGQVDDTVRAKNLELLGGLPKGGRPARPLVTEVEAEERKP
jgi:predicted ArsR family transcriptional regulator